MTKPHPSLATLKAAAPFLVAAALTLTLVAFPRLPLGSDIESSWVAVFGYARQKGLQLGVDIAFTYGPLAFLFHSFLSPIGAGWRLLSDIVLTFVSVTGVCLVAWHLALFWRWLVLALLFFMGGNADIRAELLLTIGLQAWVLLCLLVPERRAAIACALTLVGLSVFASLGKITFLVLVTLALLSVAWEFLLRGWNRWALALPVAFGASFVLAWCAFGQKISSLVPFLRYGWEFSSGYDRAMQIPGFPVQVWAAAVMLALAWTATALRCWSKNEKTTFLSGLRRGAIWLWLSAWLFLVWKHGFVRPGREHVEVYFAGLPLMVIMLEALPGAASKSRQWARALSLSCCIVSWFALETLFAAKLTYPLSHPFRLTAEHARNLLHPLALRRQLEDLQTIEVSGMDLPKLRHKIGPSTVDVFGQNQAYALFNGLNYHPRPVFQSYAAYTPSLLKFNEQFYLSQNAPQYVLFRLDPLGDIFPPLEDALVFRGLLENYKPIDAEPPFLLLQANKSGPSTMQLLSQGHVKPGQPIDVAKWADSDLWLELDLEPSLAGRAVTFLYRAPAVDLRVWCAANNILRQAKFRCPALMLSTGFVSSPLLLDDQDVLDLYTGKPVARPVAYSVALARGTSFCWKHNVGFRLYKIERQLGHSASPELTQLMKYPGFEVAPAAIVASTNAWLKLLGKPALYLPPGSYMRIPVPDEARFVKGGFGLAAASYSFGGNTEGADFRIEEMFPDGHMQLLHSRILRPRTNPDDRGLQIFSVPCPGQGERQLLFRILPLANNPSPSDLTCWAEIGFR